MYNFDFDYIKNGTPIVTLSPLGIAFNRASGEILGNPEKILIGYDVVSHAIGIKTANYGDNNAYVFAARAKNDWIRIGCRDFIKKLAVDTEMEFDKKAVQFIAIFDSELSMLIIHIDEKHRKTQR